MFDSRSIADCARLPLTATRGRGVAILLVAACVLVLSACKQRDWRDRPNDAADRPRPTWVDAEPHMPGQLAFGRGRNHFDDAVSQVRSPLRAEAMARQSVAVSLKPAMEEVARMLVLAVPQPDSPPGPAGPVGVDASANADAPEKQRREREQRELIDALSREIARETARAAVVIDRWFDDTTRTWHTLAASRVEESLFRMQLELRDRMPEARETLLPAHACRVKLAGPRMESAAPMRRRDVEPAMDETIWPLPQPNAPGTTIYAGARVECGGATASASTADVIARSRLAERVSRVARAALMDWADATQRRDAWLGDDRADDIASATGCDAAESAQVLTMAADPLDPDRSRDSGWLLAEMGDSHPDHGDCDLPWYAPTALRPRVTRVLLEVPFDLVLARLVVRIRQAALGGRPQPANDDDAQATVDDTPIPEESQLRSMLANAQTRILGRHSLILDRGR